MGKKTQRRASAKQTDKSWAVKVNHPYRELPANSITAESKSDDQSVDSIPEKLPDMGRESTASGSIRESIMEEESEEDEDELPPGNPSLNRNEMSGIHGSKSIDDPKKVRTSTKYLR